jgi:RNA polymerase sigma-70 factor (ECF subfamily)
VQEQTIPSASRDPDLDLVEAFRRGHGAAFDGLVTRHEARVHRLACRMLGDSDAALDAAQEAFVKAWKALPRFKGDSKFSTWLTRIAINQCRNELRRRRTVKHTQPVSLDGAAPGPGGATSRGGGGDGEDRSAGEAVAAAGPEPWEVARGREVAAALSEAIAVLDAESKEVLLLRDAEDLSYEEIAEVLDVPVGTVRSRLHRARAEVRRKMGGVLKDGP